MSPNFPRSHSLQETRGGSVFGALVDAAYGEPLRPVDHSIQLTMTVSGDDVGDYLEPGDTFVLWRGRDIGRGVISRRLFFGTDAP